MTRFKTIFDLKQHLILGGTAFVYNPWKRMSTPVRLENNIPVIKGDITLDVMDKHLSSIVSY